MIDRIAYNEDEACESTGLGKTKLREEVKAGRLIARKAGARNIYSPEDLKAWRDALPRVESALAMRKCLSPPRNNREVIFLIK